MMSLTKPAEPKDSLSQTDHGVCRPIDLKELLDEAVKNEEYEKATKIRDEIKT
jgi:protein-arginine kinase activator protein McsA